MKSYKLIIFILVVFFKTETLFSNSNLFNVNNIQLEKKDKITNKSLADLAIKKGFNELTQKILLNEDKGKLTNLDFSVIKQLVTYYQITKVKDKTDNKKFVNFSITFDKNKVHELFYKKGILYSEISDKELYILPILVRNDDIFIFNNNYFYDNWNKIYKNDLIEFILPLENIETIQKVNNLKDNLLGLEVSVLFKEYLGKNLALIFIEDNKNNKHKVYLKTFIQGKNISKGISIKKENLSIDKIYEEIVLQTKKELINLVKSRNLIDIRTPSFLNTKFNLNKKNNFVELNSRIKNIDLIENIYVQEFNKDNMSLKIKYLGKLENIINQLKQENIDLKLVNDQWIIKTL